MILLNITVTSYDLQQILVTIYALTEYFQFQLMILQNLTVTSYDLL